MLDLVGRRGAVDAAVGDPPGRYPRPAPPPESSGSLAAVGGVAEDLLQVDILVELLKLTVAGLVQRLLERVGQGAGRGLPAVVAVGVIAAG